MADYIRPQLDVMDAFIITVHGRRASMGNVCISVFSRGHLYHYTDVPGLTHYSSVQDICFISHSRVTHAASRT